MVDPLKGILFGKIALGKGYIDHRQLLECIRERIDRSGTDQTAASIQELLVRKEYISDRQAKNIERIIHSVIGGNKISGYQIEDILHEGFNGALFKAYQVSLDRPVHIKVLFADAIQKNEVIDQFHRKARTLSGINHQGIIQGIDVGEENELYYFVLEYVEGRSLEQIVTEDGALSEDETIDIGLQMARAIQHASEHGLNHRNIRPEHILVDEEGIAKLSRFDLVRTSNQLHNIFADNGIKPSDYPFLSPEQCTGEEPDIRSDIYALGACLYWAVIGEVPQFEIQPDDHEKTDTFKPVVPPRTRNSWLSPQLNKIITKMMVPDRENRYQSPDEIIEDLLEIDQGNEPVHVTVKTREKPGPKKTKVSRDQALTFKEYLFNKLLWDPRWQTVTVLLLSFLVVSTYFYVSSGSGIQPPIEEKPPSTEQNSSRTADQSSELQDRSTGTETTTTDPDTEDQSKESGEESISKEKDTSDADEEPQETNKPSQVDKWRTRYQNLKGRVSSFEGGISDIRELMSEIDGLKEVIEHDELDTKLTELRKQFLSSEARKFYEESVAERAPEDQNIEQMGRTYQKLTDFPEIFRNTDTWDDIDKRTTTLREKINQRIDKWKQTLGDRINNRSFSNAEDQYEKLREIQQNPLYVDFVDDLDSLTSDYLREKSIWERKRVEEAQKLYREFKRKFKQIYSLSRKSIFEVSDQKALDLLSTYRNRISIGSVKSKVELYQEDVRYLKKYRGLLKGRLQKMSSSDRSVEKLIENTNSKATLQDFNSTTLQIKTEDGVSERSIARYPVRKRVALANWQNSGSITEKSMAFALASYYGSDLELAGLWLKQASDNGVGRADYYLDQIKRQSMSPHERRAAELVESLKVANAEEMDLAVLRIISSLSFYRDTGVVKRQETAMQNMKKDISYRQSDVIAERASRNNKLSVKQNLPVFEKLLNGEVELGAARGKIFVKYPFNDSEDIEDWQRTNTAGLTLDYRSQDRSVQFSGHGLWLHRMEFSGTMNLNVHLAKQQNVPNIGGVVMWSGGRGYRGMLNWHFLGTSSNYTDPVSTVLQILSLPDLPEEADYTQVQLNTLEKTGNIKRSGTENIRFGVAREQRSLTLRFNGRELLAVDDGTLETGRSGLIFEGANGRIEQITLSGRPDQDWFDRAVQQNNLTELRENLKQTALAPPDKNSTTESEQVVRAINLGGGEVIVGGIKFEQDPFQENTKDSNAGRTSSGNPRNESTFTQVMQNQRFGPGLSYNVSVPEGTYDVTLLFIENNWETSGKRLFDIFIEGKRVLNNFDIYEEIGGKNIGITRTFQNIESGDRKLRIELEGSSNAETDENATLAGLIIRRSTSSKPGTQAEDDEGSNTDSTDTGGESNGKPKEKAENIPSGNSETEPAGTSNPEQQGSKTVLDYQDVDPGEIAFGINFGGNETKWKTVTLNGDPFGDRGQKTRYGTISTKHRGSQPASLEDIYRTNRWGKNLRYTFPVANGTYSVRLFLVEDWWTKSGTRIFDVFVQGKNVLENYDIFEETGERNVGVTKTVRKVKVKDRRLNVRMTATENNAVVSGILIKRIE